MVITGIEIAGLVLGAFPLLIEGLKFYSDGVSKTKDLRKCAVVIARLDRQIQVEQKKFDQALQLYKEAARDQELDQLFDATVYELKEKLEELREQLCLDPENKMSELGWKPKDFRKRIVVAIRKDEWKETLTDISKMIQDLLDLLLIGQQQASPSSRPLKAAAKHYTRIRNQAIGLYKALEETLQGLPNATCLSPHSVSLQLEARRAPVESRKYASKQEPSCQVRFKLAIAHEKPVKTTSVEWSEVEVEAVVAEESTIATEVSGDSNTISTSPEVEPPVSSGATRATECAPTAPIKSSLGFGFRSKARASLNRLSPDKLQTRRDVSRDRDSDQSDNGVFLEASTISTSPASADYTSPPARPKRTALKNYFGSRFEQTAKVEYPGGRSHPSSVSSVSPQRTGSRPAVAFVSSTSAPIVPTISVLDEGSESHRVIDDLCTTLNSTSAIQKHHCLGMLISGQRKHRIWRNQCSSDTKPVVSVMSLDSVLKASGSDIAQQDWLVLGVRLASTVMQLHTTEWLQDRWHGTDILFPLNRNSIDSSVLNRPVITRSLEPSSKTSERKSYLDMVVQDKTLYSLGIVLLELHYGKPLSEITGDVPEASSDPEVQEHMRARWFVEHLARRTGVRYLNAVRRCIEGLDTDGKPRGLCQDEFKNLVQTQIVSELEEHLKDFSGVKDLSEIL